MPSFAEPLLAALVSAGPAMPSAYSPVSIAPAFFGTSGKTPTADEFGALVAVSMHATSTPRTAPSCISEPPEFANIALLLREQTRLPIEVLATAADVSKQRYHKWLAGAGLSPGSRARLEELRELFATIQRAQPDLRAFLNQQLRDGMSMLALIAEHKDVQVIGLALRATAPPRSVQNSGFTRVRPLGWGTSVDTERFEDFSPRALPEERTPAIEPDDEDDNDSIGLLLVGV